MKKIVMSFIILSLFLFLPHFIKADEMESSEIFEVTKYYKTVNDFSGSRTYEVSKNEYDSYDASIQPRASVGTIFKKLTSTISKNGSYYRYKAELTWKNMPGARSFDIIGIGFNGSVKVRNNVVSFSQSYCLTDGSCRTTSAHNPQVFSNGAGTAFLLPSGNLSSLSETFYFDVEKNTTATIVSQLAAADHAHATKTISLANAKKFSVSGATGIILDGISSYYDAIDPAKEIWSGSW